MPVLVPGSGFKLGAPNIIIPPPVIDPSRVIRREGIYLNVNETIGPVSITAKSTTICFGGTPGPAQPSPERIIGISISGGVGRPNTGLGCSVLIGGLPALPEMSYGLFSEPLLVYKSIFVPYPGVESLTLPVALTGKISEKYFYDGEYGSSNLSRSAYEKDSISGSSLVNGLTLIKRPFPEGKVNFKVAPRVGSVTLNTMYPRTPAEAITTHNSVVSSTSGKGPSYVVSYKPSLIRRMRYYFVISVYSTCPPYVTYFPAIMDVDNNWSYHTKRVLYRVNKQIGAAP